MSLLELGKRILGKKLAQTSEPTLPRVDADLPLGLYVGGLLTLPRAAFALLDGSLVEVPAQAQVSIEAISRIRLEADPSLMLVRAYTDRGTRREGEGESFLQVLADGETIRDLAYYQFFHRQIPMTAEEQAPFRGEGFGLGEVDFWLAEDLLSEAGLSGEKITALLAGEDALHYLRDTPGGDYIPPFAGRETRVDDAQGIQGLAQQIRFMQYTRELVCGGQERLLISFEVQDSFDGQRKQRVHVDYMVGVSLNPLNVKTA